MYDGDNTFNHSVSLVVDGYWSRDALEAVVKDVMGDGQTIISFTSIFQCLINAMSPQQHRLVQPCCNNNHDILNILVVAVGGGSGDGGSGSRNDGNEGSGGGYSSNSGSIVVVVGGGSAVVVISVEDIVNIGVEVSDDIGVVGVGVSCRGVVGVVIARTLDKWCMVGLSRQVTWVHCHLVIARATQQRGQSYGAMHPCDHQDCTTTTRRGHSCLYLPLICEKKFF